MLEKLVLFAIQGERDPLLRWVMRHHQDEAMQNKPGTFCARAAYQGNLSAIQIILSYYPDFPEEDLGPIFLEGCAGGQLDVIDWIFEENGMVAIGPDWDRAIRTSIQSEHLAVLRWLLERARVTSAYRETLLQFAREHLSRGSRLSEIYSMINQRATLEPNDVCDYTFSQISQMIVRNQIPEQSWLPLLMDHVMEVRDSFAQFVRVLDHGGFLASELAQVFLRAADRGLSRHLEYLLDRYQIEPDYQQMMHLADRQRGLEINSNGHHEVMRILLERYPVDLSANQAELMCTEYYLPEDLCQAYQEHTRAQPLLFVYQDQHILLASLEPVVTRWEAYPVSHQDLSFVVYWDPEKRTRGGPEPPIFLLQRAHDLLVAQMR